MNNNNNILTIDDSALEAVSGGVKKNEEFTFTAVSKGKCCVCEQKNIDLNAASMCFSCARSHYNRSH